MSPATQRPLRFLVLDAYAREGRRALEGVGATLAGRLYTGVLERLAPACAVDVAYPADADFTLPTGVALSAYDGFVWTGSSLTIHDTGDPRVARQIEFARAAAESGVPAFGSCWAAQVATVAAGGRCGRNPSGREFGVARTIEIRDTDHPLYRDKPRVFDAFTSHADEVHVLAPGSAHLAGNAFSSVQAVDVPLGTGHFWAVQYHPEYDPHEVARLCVLRGDELVAQGTFADSAAVCAYVDALETLHADPSRSDLRERLGIGDDLLLADVRTLEVANWIRAAVVPAFG